MKRLGMLFLMTTIFSMIITLPVTAQNYLLPEGLEFAADHAFYAKYVWKGFTLDKDPVLQSTVALSYKGLTLSIWNSMDIKNQADNNSDEVDYSIDYTYAVNKFSFSIGHIYYDFPGAGGYTKEYTAGVSYDCFLSPSLLYAHDYESEDAEDYFALDLAHSFSLGKVASLDLSLHIGFNDAYWIEGNGGDVGLTASLTLPLTENLTFSPNVTFSEPYGDLADELDGNQDGRVFGGVIMGYSF